MDRDLIKVWSIAMMIGMTVLVLHLFTAAYASGGQVIVTITEFGEANVELLFLHLFVTPVIAAGVYFLAADA